MSFRTTMILVLIILILAGGAGGGAYIYFTKKNAELQGKYTNAINQMKDEEYEKALQSIDEMKALNLRGSMARDLAVARIKTLMELNRKEEAQKSAEQFLKESPNAPQAVMPRLTLASLAIEGEDYPKASQYYQEVVAKSVEDSPARLEAEVGLARIKAAQNNLKEAQASLLVMMDKALPDDLSQVVKKALGEVNLKMLFSRVTTEKDEIYALQPGDSLMALSMKYGVTMATLSKKNGIADARSLSVGRRLIIPHNEFSIVVDRFNNTLTVYNNGKFFKEYQVRTGMHEYMTPVGDFEIQNKKINPTWTDPQTGKLFTGGHPENELGTRWMAFQEPMLGIHGTIHPETIGLYTSHGCVGMLMPDVEELSDIIPLKTPLKIKGDRNPELVKKSAGFVNANDAHAGVGV